MLTSLIIGALGSLIASVAFIFALYRLRPQLELSSQIAKTTYDDKTVYAFKVVNSGRRDAISVEAELFIVEPQVIAGGIGYNILEVKLVRNKIFHLRPLSKVGDKLGSVFEFITMEDLETVWNEYKNSYILFRVKAQDSFSGFYRVFTSEFYSKTDIVAGRFAKGANMNILGQ